MESDSDNSYTQTNSLTGGSVGLKIFSVCIFFRTKFIEAKSKVIENDVTFLKNFSNISLCGYLFYQILWHVLNNEAGIIKRSWS